MAGAAHQRGVYPAVRDLRRRGDRLRGPGRITNTGSAGCSTPVNRIVTGLFVLALLLHAWVGMRDVILDYVHNTVVRIFALSLVLAVLFGSGFWCAKVLLLELIL